MQAVADILAAQGSMILFPLALVEGPVVVLTAAALADLAGLNLWAIWLVAVAADLVGDCILYGLGRFLPDAVPRSLRPKTQIAQLGRMFAASGATILLTAKLTHVAGLPTLVAAGIARMPFAGFFWWNLVGTAVKATAMVLAGWGFGLSILRIWEGGMIFPAIGAALLVIVLILFWRFWTCNRA